MRIHTVKGSCYVLTCTAACRVQAVRPNGGGLLLVLEADKAGQFCFVAPTDAVEVSDEHALVVQTLKGASLGLPAQGGGIGNGQSVTLNSLDAITMDCSDTATFQKMDVSGPASFSSGVTMGQSLNVAGPASFNTAVTMGKSLDVTSFVSIKGECRVRGAIFPGVDDTSGGWIQHQYDHLWLSGGGNSRTNELTVHIGDRNNLRYANLEKDDAKPGSLNDKSVLNRREADERWLKFDNTLTAAQYAALAVKDQTTLYITSDTGKIYLGNHVLN